MDKIAADAQQAAFLLGLVRGPDGASPLPHITDWRALTGTVREHGLLPLLFWRLSECEPAMPEDVARGIREEGRRNAARNAAVACELLSRLAAFERAGIPALPFKGVALAAQLYGDFTHRPVGDIDILINFKDRHRAAAILQEAGYVQQTRESGAIEFEFRRESDGQIVELCWRLTPSWFRRDFGMDLLWPRTRAARLLGTEIRSLSRELTLILLCVHGSKHHWMRLFWISDMVQLLSKHGDLDWDSVERDARPLGLWRSVALGVLLCHQLGVVEVEEPVLRRFQRDARVERLAGHLKSHLFDGRYYQLDGWPNQYPLLDFGDRVRLLLKAGSAAPTQRDLEFIHLPQAIHFLYFFVRPFRLARDYLMVLRYWGWVDRERIECMEEISGGRWC